MIDIDKLIIALFKSDRFNYQNKQIVRELLQEQGLEFKNGSIVNLEIVEQEPIDPDIQKIIDCHFDEMLDEPDKSNLHDYLYGDGVGASKINLEEMNDFEKAVQQFAVCCATAGTEDIVVDKTSVEKLFSIARRHIVENIDVDAMVDEYEEYGEYPSQSFMYREGIEDVLNKIKREWL